MTPGQQIITALLAKYPRHGKQTIARIAYKEHPEAFANREAARSLVRTVCGANGQQNRKTCTVKIDRALGKAGETPFGEIPPQRNPFKSLWRAIQIDGPAKVLLLNDIHLPYHEKMPLVAALKYGKDRNPDIVLLNGDTLDAHAVSFWQKDPRERDFADELNQVKLFLAILRSEFPKASIIFKHGNHEERWQSYMFAKAPEVLGVKDFELKSLLRFRNRGIQEVAEKRPIRLGDLNVVHGHEYRFAISNPVNAARGLFLRAKAYAICGHFHQSSFHSENNVELKSIATWSVGCLCQLHQDYAPLNNWRHGFAWIEVDKSGKFEVENKTIKHGKIYS